MRRARIIIAAAAAAVAAAGAGITATATSAGAGIGPGGYAQIAQRDLNRDHQVGFYGYTATCHGVYSNYATAQVRVVCYLNEKG